MSGSERSARLGLQAQPSRLGTPRQRGRSDCNPYFRTAPPTRRRYWDRVYMGKFLSAPQAGRSARACLRSEEHTSELQSHSDLVCRLLLEKKKRVYIRPDFNSDN